MFVGARLAGDGIRLRPGPNRLGAKLLQKPGSPKLDDFQRVFKLRLRTAHRSFFASFEGARAPGHASNRSGRSPRNPVSRSWLWLFSRRGGRGREAAPTKESRKAYGFSGNRKPETGNRKPETGNRKPETGNRKPETGNRKPINIPRSSFLR